MYKKLNFLVAAACAALAVLPAAASAAPATLYLGTTGTTPVPVGTDIVGTNSGSMSVYTVFDDGTQRKDWDCSTLTLDSGDLTANYPTPTISLLANRGVFNLTGGPGTTYPPCTSTPIAGITRPATFWYDNPCLTGQAAFGGYAFLNSSCAGGNTTLGVVHSMLGVNYGFCYYSGTDGWFTNSSSPLTLTGMNSSTFVQNPAGQHDCYGLPNKLRISGSIILKTSAGVDLHLG